MISLLIFIFIHLTATYCFSVIARALFLLHVAMATRFEVVAALVVGPLDASVSRDVSECLRGSPRVLPPELKNKYNDEVTK